MNKLTQTMELEPAYGRDYKSKSEVETAFRAGKDFIGDYTIGFKPVNICDIEPGTTQLLRYRAKTMVAVVKV